MRLLAQIFCWWQVLAAVAMPMTIMSTTSYTSLPTGDPTYPSVYLNTSMPGSHSKHGNHTAPVPCKNATITSTGNSSSVTNSTWTLPPPVTPPALTPTPQPLPTGKPSLLNQNIAGMNAASFIAMMLVLGIIAVSSGIALACHLRDYKARLVPSTAPVQGKLP